MAAALDDAALLQDHDAVCVADSGEAVGDDEAGAAVHQAVHAALHQSLGAGVDGGSSLIEDEHRRVGDGCAGDGQQLTLALRQVRAVAGQHGVVALGQALDEAVGVGQTGCGDALLVGGLQTAIADVLHDRAGEQVGILQHDAQRAAEVGFLDLVDVDAVVPDLAVLDVVEAVDKVGDGGLAGTGGADEGDLLARTAIEVDVVQDGLARHIAEIDIRKGDVAFQLVVGGGAVVVGMLPGPDAGALVGLHEVVVLVVLGVDEGDIALIGLAGLIHHLEDALCTGQCHDDAVGLHGHLADGHIEALVQGQERHDSTQRDAAHAGDGHGCTHQSADGVADVAQLSVDGHHDVGEAVGLLGAVLELVIQLAEALEGLLLVGEDLDDLLAFHHLFDVAVHLAEVALLCDEVLAALLGDLLGAEEHQGHHQHGDDGELPAQHAHAGKDGNDGDGAGHQLRDALAEHLAEGIDVVGVDGHDVAVGMGVKVADGQALHVGEELDAQVAQGTLGDVDHDAGVEPGGEDAHHIDAADAHQRPGQRCKAGVLLLGHGDDIVVNEGLEEQACLHIGQRADHDADEHEDAVRQIVLEHLCHDALEQLARVLDLRTRASHAAGAGAMDDFCFLFCHYCSPPCLSKSPPP